MKYFEMPSNLSREEKRQFIIKAATVTEFGELKIDDVEPEVIPVVTEWSGRTTSYSHKFDDWATKPADDSSAIIRPIFLDVQWSDCPVEVEREVVAMWRNHELWNDVCIVKTTIDDLEDDGDSTVCIRRFIKERVPEVENNELIIIHWWW